jgi:acyl-activating enzyme 14
MQPTCHPVTKLRSVLTPASVRLQSLVKLAMIGTRPDDTYLHAAALFHVGGLSSAFAALMAGCRQVRLRAWIHQ